MKKYTILMTFLPVLLCSCSSKNVNTEEHVDARNFKVYNSTTPSPDAITPLLTETTTAPPPKRLSYAFTGNELELLLDEQVVKTIELQFPAEDPPTENDVVISDFDLDGYYDVFVYYYGHPDNLGDYYTFDPSSETFKESESLNEVGRFMVVNPDNTLSATYPVGNIERTVLYKWEDKKLKAFEKREVYPDIFDNTKTHTDVYKYNKFDQPYLDETIIE